MNTRRRIMNESILPNGYTQVEYIELPNGASINTEYVPTGTSVVISGAFMALGFTHYGRIIATYKDESTNVYRIIQASSDNQKLYANCGSKASGGSTLVDYQKNVKYNFVMNYNKIILNGTETTLNTTLGNTNDAPLIISSLVSSTAVHMRLYSLYVKDGDIEKLHLIPCIYNNVAGLYDLVNKRFLTSATSTACITNPTLIFNQLVKNGNFINGTNDWTNFSSTISVANNQLTIVKTTTSSYGGIAIPTFGGSINTSHKYYIKATVKSSSSSVEMIYGFHASNYTVNGNTMLSSTSTEWTTISGIVSPKANNCILLLRVGMASTPVNTTGYGKNIQCIDLTTMFGAGNEPQTAEEFETMFPAIYYDYVIHETLYGRTLQLGEFWPNPVCTYETEIEYLESTGTQYIDTGIKGFMNHTYEIDFQQVDTNKYRIWGVFGQQSYIGYNMSLTYGNTDWLIRWESETSKSRSISTSNIDTNRHIIKIVDGQCYFDNISKGISDGHNTNTSINNNLFLFTINPANTTPTSNAKVRIYSYKDIDKSGNIVRDFIPVRVGAIGYMYDKISKQLFGNVGTGDFVLGPDI